MKLRDIGQAVGFEVYWDGSAAQVISCQQAGIPCILKHGGNHQWNMVYIEGRWWDVDVTADDCDEVSFYEAGAEMGQYPFDGTDEFRERYYADINRILRTEESFPDEDPEITKFAQEVLAPGSSRQ